MYCTLYRIRSASSAWGEVVYTLYLILYTVYALLCSPGERVVYTLYLLLYTLYFVRLGRVSRGEGLLVLVSAVSYRVVQDRDMYTEYTV